MRIEKINNCKDENDRFADNYLNNFKGKMDEYVYDIYYDEEICAIVAEIWNEEDEEREDEILALKNKNSAYFQTQLLEPKSGELSSFFRGNEMKFADESNLNERFCDIEPEVWQKEIQQIWKSLLFSGEDNPRNPRFLEAIWHASTVILPKLEVSIIVDRDGKLFMNRGSPGFVDYKGVDLKGMKIPIQSWIHTHPFGLAFWSGTDTDTIKNWRFILGEATVLGNKERLTWVREQATGQETMIKTVVKEEGFEL
tara:strand:- start:21533 stop:22294 length:762 start_codon:yes stop_codon:yes gene_type:complete